MIPLDFSNLHLPLSLQVCVSECPSENWFYTGGKTSADRAKLICRDNVDPMDTSIAVFDLVTEGHCAYYYVESRSCECNGVLLSLFPYFFCFFIYLFPSSSCCFPPFFSCYFFPIYFPLPQNCCFLFLDLSPVVFLPFFLFLRLFFFLFFLLFLLFLIFLPFYTSSFFIIYSLIYLSIYYYYYYYYWFICIF